MYISVVWWEYVFSFSYGVLMMACTARVIYHHSSTFVAIRLCSSVTPGEDGGREGMGRRRRL